MSARRVGEMNCGGSLLLLALFAFLLFIPGEGRVLNNTCVHGSNYLQMVGFACVREEEQIRNPSWTGTWATQGDYNIRAYELMNYNFNLHGIHIGNATYCANFTVVNAGCSGSIEVNDFPRTVSREWAQKADYFFADYGSTLSMPNIIEVNAVEKPIFVPLSSATTTFKCKQEWMDAGMQPECQRPGDKRFPWVFSMLIPGENVITPVVTMYKLAGVRNITIWNEIGSFPETVAEGVEVFSQYTGIPTVEFTVPASPTQEQINDLARKIKEANSDGVIGAAYAPACPKVLAALKELNYMPPALAQMNCAAEPDSKNSVPDAIYQLDRAEYDRRMSGHGWSDDFWYPPSGDGKGSAELVYLDFQQRTGHAPHFAQAMALAAGLVLHKVLERVETVTPLNVRQAIQLFSEPTFVGQIGFSAWGQNNAKDVIVYQADQNFDLQIIYPLGSATSKFIYPAPTFDERVFTEQYMSTTTEIVLAGVSAFFILISLLLFLFLIIFKEEPALIAASPLFLATILFGSIILYCVYFAWVLHATTATCYLRFWLLGIGFVVMFGALFAKTWRIMRIFTLTDMKVFRITNLQLILVLSILIGVEIVLLAIWSGTATPRQQVEIRDQLRPSKNRLICSSGKSSKAMLGILVAYKLSMVLYGIYMSIRIWKIPLKQFNESRSIAFSMYNMLCFGILAFALQISGTIGDPAMFIVRTICLILSTFLTICAIFGPKVYAAISGHTGYSSKGSSSKTRESYNTNSNGRVSKGFSQNKSKSKSEGLQSIPRSRSSVAESNEEPMQEIEPAEKAAILFEQLRKYKRKYKLLKMKYDALATSPEAIVINHSPDQPVATEADVESYSIDSSSE